MSVPVIKLHRMVLATKDYDAISRDVPPCSSHREPAHGIDAGTLPWAKRPKNARHLRLIATTNRFFWAMPRSRALHRAGSRLGLSASIAIAWALITTLYFAWQFTR